MVNSNIPNFLEAGNLDQTLLKTRTFLAVEFGRRLFAAGLHEFAELASQVSKNKDEVHFSRSAGDWLSKLGQRSGSLFFHQFVEATALESVLRSLRSLERGALKYFASLSQKNLNVIDGMPSTSQLSARSLECVLAASFFRASDATGARTGWERHAARLEKGLVTALAKNQLDASDCQGLALHEHEGELATVGLCIIASLETLTHTLDFWLTRAPTIQPGGFRLDDERLVARTRAFIELRERCLNDYDCERGRHLLHKARSLVLARRFEDFAQVVTEQLAALQRLVSTLSELDSKAISVPVRENTLTYESLVYVEAFANKLKSLGEVSDDVDKLKESLFNYSMRCKVPCGDVLDEEVVKLAPLLRKESITRAKLELRLNDPQYPLSVVSKETIMRLVKMAAE